MASSILSTVEQERLGDADEGLRQVMAHALARAGRVENARRMIEHSIERHQQAGTRGPRLGLAYETAARIAIAARDEFAATRYTALCAEEYKGGRDLLLKAKLERLMHEADEFGEAAAEPAIAQT